MHIKDFIRGWGTSFILLNAKYIGKLFLTKKILYSNLNKLFFPSI